MSCARPSGRGIHFSGTHGGRYPYSRSRISVPERNFSVQTQVMRPEKQTFSHPDCNRRLWNSTRSCAEALAGCDRRWGLAPRPEGFMSTKFYRTVGRIVKDGIEVALRCRDGIQSESDRQVLSLQQLLSYHQVVGPAGMPLRGSDSGSGRCEALRFVAGFGAGFGSFPGTARMRQWPAPDCPVGC